MIRTLTGYATTRGSNSGKGKKFVFSKRSITLVGPSNPVLIEHRGLCYHSIPSSSEVQNEWRCASIAWTGTLPCLFDTNVHYANRRAEENAKTYICPQMRYLTPWSQFFCVILICPADQYMSHLGKGVSYLTSLYYMPKQCRVNIA